MLQKYEVPVACSMLDLLRRLEVQEPTQRFIFLWIAFNNIYTTLSDKTENRRRQVFDADGNIRTSSVSGITMPRPQVPKEKEQIKIAFQNFSVGLKKSLILHKSTEFFVNRSPKWNGIRITTDGKGQRLNGVLKVGYTTSAEHPVWSPINVNAYERFIANEPEAGDEDLLAEQILWVLYSVRNNTFHGGKRMDDSNDREVLENAIPLLSLIIIHLLHGAGNQLRMAVFSLFQKSVSTIEVPC